MVETVISIRTARLGDEVQIARVHDSAWREAYQGVIPGRELQRMILRRGPAWWRQAIRGGTRLMVLDFADAVAWVARSLPTRPPSNPVLAGVLITGSDDGLTVAGFDFDVSAEVQVPAEIASTGTVLVSGRLLSDITRALPAKPVDVSVDGSRMLLSCGSAKFSLPAMPVEDYPALPALPEETGVVAADLFTEAVGQVAIAAGRDDTLPMLTGIRVEISGDKVVLAATDRFRLAVFRSFAASFREWLDETIAAI